MSGPEEIQRKHTTPPVQPTVSVPVTPVPAQTQAPNSVFTSGSSSSASGSVSVKRTTEASEVSQQSQGADTTKAKQVLDEYIENNYDQLAELSRKEQLDAIIGILSRKGDLTQEEQLILSLAQAELNSYEEPSVGVGADGSDASENTENATVKKVKTESEIRAEKKQKEYQDIYSKEGTAYEKTSRIIDKYLMENDSNYAKLQSEKAKQQYRDNLIKSFREQMDLDSNITPAQRSVMQDNIAKLIINAASQGKMIVASSKNNSPKCNLSRTEIEQDLANTPDSKFKKIIDSIEIDPNKSPKEQLHTIIDKYLTETDNEYKKLKTEKDKSEYIQKKLGEYTQKMFSIDINKLDKSEKESLELLALAAFKEVKESGTSIESLMNSDKQQAFIAQILTENKNLLNNIKDSNTKLIFERTLKKAEIYNTIRINDPDKIIHEKDILNKLKEMKKNGQIDGNKALEQLYEYYSNAEKMDANLPKGQKMLDQTANTTSLVGMASVLGMTPEKFISKQVLDDNGKLLSKDDLVKKLSNPALKNMLGDCKDDVGIRLIHDYLIKSGCSKEDVSEILTKANLYNAHTAFNAMARKDCDTAAKITNGIANYGIKEEKDAVTRVAGASSAILDDKSGMEFTDSLNDNAYAMVADAFNTGIHINWSQQQQDAYRNSIVTDANVTAERKTAFTKSYISTGTAEQQLHDSKYLSTVKDAAVTEGLAAAEKFVDASVKSQYRSYVDNAIKNNGYSQAEINNINAARETGKTSYERNIEVQSTNSAQPLKSQTKVSTQQSTVTNISTAQISYSKSTVKLSAANSDLPKQFAQTLLQLQYQASVAQKEKAMQDLQNIIDKIQNDQEVRAQKQAKIKAKEASTDEEIAEAIKTADEKSAQTQKTDEEKIANESKESIGELNEVVETPKIEEVAKKFNISVDDVKELQEAHRQGDLNTIYTKLGSISVDAQKKFVQFISRKDTATIIGFIRNRSTDKSLIKELCRLNPNLIKSLDPDLLLDCGIAKADIIKYAGASQLAAMLASQARLGHTDVLNQFYEALGYNKDVSYNNKNAFLPGGDGFYSSYNRQDNSAAIASNTIPNRQASHDGAGSTKPPRFYYDV